MKTAEELTRAIKEIEQSGLGGNQIHTETLQTALEVLKDRLRSMEGCFYCNADSGVVSVEGLTTTDIQERSTNTWVTHRRASYRYKAKLCPNCGRPLITDTEGKI